MIKVKFNDIDLYETYGLILSNNDYLGIPKIKTEYIEIPNSSKIIDLSSAYSYEMRTITLKMGCIREKENYPKYLSDLLSEFQGQKVRLSFSNDIGWHYNGRVEILNFNRFINQGYLDINILCEPFKYRDESSSEDWKWDSFSFVDSVIREHKNINVNGNKLIKIGKCKIPTVPTFIVENLNGDGFVTFINEEFSLKNGKNYIPEIRIQKEINLIFKGNFNLSIDLRERSL